MSDLHYPDLQIQGFRGIKDLSIPQLGRVTLITGKNNTGKSSVLEALRIHTQNAAAHVLHSVLASRDEYVWGMDEHDRPYDTETMFHSSVLFHGFPKIADDIGSILISTSGKSRGMKLSLWVEWFVEHTDSDGSRRLLPGQEDLFGERELVAALVAQTEERRLILTLDSLHRQSRTRRGLRPRPSDIPRMPCTFVGSYGTDMAETLGEMWDQITLTPSEHEVIEALQIIDPRISAINMVGGEGAFRTKKALVRVEHIGRPVPLRSFGDGMNRLFAIILALVNSRGGLLLIDEFENGLHHSVQLDAWRMIFRLAQDLDVQVFATSHSWDAVETFQKAAEEVPEQGVLLRLTRRYDKIFATVFAEQELAVATRHNIEVR